MSDDLLNDLWCDGSMLSARAFDEIERLRAELAAEREYREDLYRESVRNMKAALEARAERDALRELLREARKWVPRCSQLELSIDAALKETP